MSSGCINLPVWGSMRRGAGEDSRWVYVSGGGALSAGRTDSVGEGRLREIEVNSGRVGDF